MVAMASALRLLKGERPTRWMALAPLVVCAVFSKMIMFREIGPLDDREDGGQQAPKGDAEPGADSAQQEGKD